MATFKEPGEDAHPKGGYTPGMFADVQSVDDFARVLCVPTKSIALIRPTNDNCRSKGCPFKAIDANHGHCPAHERSWYPLKQQKGGRWLGPEFLRGSSNPSWSCSCNEPTCISAGYFPGQGGLHVKKEWRVNMSKTPHLFSSEKREAYKNNPDKKMYLYPWHFYPEHREKTQDGKWKLKEFGEGERYFDEDRFTYNYPPPRNSVQRFLNNEYFTDSYIRPHDRWAKENTESEMPTWMVEMMIADGSATKAPRKEMSKGQLRCEFDMWKQRALFERREREQEVRELRDQLAGTKRKYEELSTLSAAEIAKEKEKLARAKEVICKLEIQLEEAREALDRLHKEKGRPLRYDDLYEGGFLSKHVEAFTFFNTVAQNDAFLELINYADGSEGAHVEGDGMCENLRRYSDNVKWEERRGEVDPPSMDPESDEYKTWLRKSKAARKGGRTWKDDFLSFCIYVRSGLTEDAAATLSGIGTKRMSDILHEWAQVLDDALCEMFPQPTRSQILQAYPVRLLEADGHARNSMLLDAFEIFAEASSNPNVSSSEHSDYKKHTTIKFLGATDPIGCAWKDTVPDGNPGRASDVMMTADTKILRQVPFGHTCKVDKGFLVDNEAGHEGIFIDRPQKRLKKQQQQSSVDTSQTQKIGNTRITVENVNGELKDGVRYLNGHVKVIQFGIVSKIVRIGYLMQNFKKAIIQHREPTDGEGRPCRAEIRWHGATDEGLVDVRDNVRLWGLKSEIGRHKELSAMEEHKMKSATEISEMVLSENHPLRKRQELYEKHNGTPYEYDGKY